jgi:hypothetical protein
MMAKSRAQQAAIAISMKKAGKTPKGYHKMPDGTVMKNSAHNKLSASKKSLAKAQVGKQMSDSVFNQKYKPDPGFFKSPPKDWKPKDIDPGFNKEPKGSYTPKKPKLSKDGYIQYKKGGAVPKAQSGLSIGQGPNNTVAKSNIGPKIAAAIGSATTATGLAVNKLKKKRQAKLEKLKNEQTPEKKKGGSTGDKKWIQKAINPKHKGYCTPMTKPTCTPKRKALAKTLKAMAKKR